MSVTVTAKSDGTSRELSALPTDSGSFKMSFLLDKHSQTGTYIAQATYLTAVSSKISFIVTNGQT